MLRGWQIGRIDGARPMDGGWEEAVTDSGVHQAGLRQCAILAGGLASRLGALATAIPKPILPIGDRPFLAWLMREW